MTYLAACVNSNPSRLPSRLIVALDTDTRQEALALVEALQPLGVTFKVGMQLFYHEGMGIVHALRERDCKVFVDLKLHDIPNTVARATAALVRQGVSFLNVHTTGGAEMMAAAARGARQAAAESDAPADSSPMVIGVTLLTSLSPTALAEELRVSGLSVADYVVHLAKLAQASGLDGVVCSAQEAPSIRAACGPNFVLVTPGIRPAGAAQQDQSRVLTPGQALEAGAHYLVVGRPITGSADPQEAAAQILAEMAAASSQD